MASQKQNETSGSQPRNRADAGHVRHRRYAARAAILALSLAGIAAAAGAAMAQFVPSPIQPTVFPVLQPGSAVNIPLVAQAGGTDVWVSADGVQHILLTGHVLVSVGYRTLRADNAAVWLTPIAFGGSSIYKAEIFLAGHVSISEGRQGKTVSRATEMLVTTQISGGVRLGATNPVAAKESGSPIVLRGEKLIRELAARPVALNYIPTVQVQPTETALGLGWIARGARNQVSPLITSSQQARNSAAHGGALLKPALVFATGDKISVAVAGNQRVTTAEGEFILVRQVPGQAALELRANDAVLFSPAGSANKAPPVGPHNSIAEKVQGVYLDGDVTITQGNQTVHASSVYYDFTTNRAIMLDAVLSTYDVAHHSPLYMRAKKILQLARGSFAAKSVKLSTDDFYVPHYYIGAGSMTVQAISGPVVTQPNGHGGAIYAYTGKDITGNFMGLPFFYWPEISGTTAQPTTPLRSFGVGYSNTFGASVTTDWNLLELLGQNPIPGIDLGLNLDEYSNRGPGLGINSRFRLPDQPNAHGSLQSFIMYDDGTDQLGANRDNLPLSSHVRGFVSGRYQQDLSRQWTLAVQGSYISDENFLEQYFQNEYATAPEQQTSIDLRQQHDTEGFTIIGKWNLNRFVANADLEDNEFSVQRYPEAHYWRQGDKLLGIFTYYSDTSGGVLNDKFSSLTPAQRALTLNFPGMNPNESFSNYYLANGWTDNSVVRGDTRQEIDLPLGAGPIEFTPFVTGRLTYWDTSFPVTNNQTGGNTTRAWGAGGFRSTATFWKVYHGFNSDFLDVHSLRHIIQPEVSLFASGSNVQRGYLQPFDRNVEGITDASGAEFALRQILQTKRGRPGERQIVDWITLNVSADMFWNVPTTGPFNAANPIYAGAPFSTSDFGQPTIGYYDFSRPELSQVADSLNANATWRAGANVRVLADESYNLDVSQLEEFDTGVVIDQSPDISYFLGNSYIRALETDQWTVSMDYRLTEKYSFAVTQSYDFAIDHNILSQLTIVRKLPRFYSGITLSYNADTRSEAVFFSIWPAGYPQYGITNTSALQGALP